MNKLTLFQQYVADRRHQQIDGFKHEGFPGFVRYTPLLDGMEGVVMYTDLPVDQTASQIMEQTDYFHTLGVDFEWKVYAFDQPESLAALLRAQGFVPDEEEALMMFSLQEAALKVSARQREWDVKRIDDLAGLADVVAVQEQVWERDFGWLYEQLVDTLLNRPETLSMFGAYHDGQPIGSGWTEYPAGSRFPELHGGAVLSAFRGRGVYGDLFHVRFVEARQRHYEFVAVDASPMSRPILERIGFQHICMTQPYRKKLAKE
ncbi:GNAT family N-acetyltransferase [Chitinivorax sp. B]|uniref:GNAT family N-acetyltransferase n=1 Tax=Chitinivorax sp. B TaxID=2502235 RepID=UPI0010F5662C|nr:GNAT family N-acetyltransferase [Chitinivorax sp. B]